MSLYETYNQWLHKKITDDEAAEQFRMTVSNFRMRVSKYGKRLAVVLKTLDRISDDEITRDQAATILNITTRQVNNLQEAWRVSRPLKQYLITRTVSTVKWELRKRFAVEFIAGSATIEDCAANAGVSVRQMRRWVGELLDKHYGIVFKDLKVIPDKRRARMADEIEEAEGLEIAKINVLNEVARGEKAIQEVALERIMSKRTVRKNNV